MSITRRVVHWAAQECSWQVSGELSVAAMIDAWLFASNAAISLTQPRLVDVLEIGRIVEPVKNADGLRWKIRVGLDVKMHSDLISAALDQLVDSWIEMDPVDAFAEFEEIHPFVDGNGRTGSILFNWLRGSLRRPIHPPNLWDDPRRASWPGYPEPLP